MAALLTVLLFWLPLAQIQAQTPLPALQIYTEDWPPYQFERDGRLQGIAIDLLEAMLARLDSSQTRQQFQLIPWARGYRYLQQQPNTLLFSVVRTDEREPQFHWVGPIFDDTTYLICLAERELAFDSIDQLHRFSVVTLSDDVSESYVQQLPVQPKRHLRTPESLSAIRLLQKGRVDFMVDNLSNLEAVAAKAGLSMTQFKPVHVINQGAVYFALNLETPLVVVERLQLALDQLKQSGEYQRIFARYQ